MLISPLHAALSDPSSTLLMFPGLTPHSYQLVCVYKLTCFLPHLRMAVATEIIC